MAEKNFVADKPTLDETKAIVADIQTKVNQMQANTGTNVSMTGFGNAIFSYVPELSVRSTRTVPVIAKFIAPVSGVYNIKLYTEFQKVVLHL